MARIGFAISGGLAPSEIVECVVLAEELGYESAWVAEGHGGDQFAILTACAMATQRILLGTSISSVFVRSIPTIAMAAATVDELSKQRFILGLGSSHRVQVEPEHGQVYSKPIQRVRESVEVIRTLLRDGEISNYHGETVSIEHFDFWFQPARREMPIYLAGLFPKMLEVCGEIAQGVMMTRSTLDTGRTAAEHIATGARRAGRKAEDIDISTLLPCCVAEDPRAAFDEMRPGIAFYMGFFPRYNRLMAESGFADVAQAVRDAWDRGDRDAATRAVPDELMASTSAVGTPAECRERIEAYRQSGIDLPIISPRSGGKAGALAAIRACAPSA